jgi:hypothetical protein
VADNAGFALVACASQDLINLSLQALQATLAPPYTFQYPLGIFGAGMSVSGSLGILAPHVVLAARPDDLITLTLSFAGTLAFTSGSGTTETATVVLSTTLTAGLFADVTTSPAGQVISVGADTGASTVELVQFAVVTGPAISSAFAAALNSKESLATLQAAVRAIPRDRLTFAFSGVTVPNSLNQTYQPPGGSIFMPATLFAFDLQIARVVVRPLGAADGTTGALVVAIDMGAPVATQGDPQALIDLTRAPAVAGYAFDNVSKPHRLAGTPVNAANSAVTVNGTWVTTLVNTIISPQLAAKCPSEDLAKNMIALTDTPDCVQLALDSFTAPLNCPYPIPTSVVLTGATITVQATLFQESHRDANDYYVGDKAVGNVEATLTAKAIVALDVLNVPSRTLSTADAEAPNAVSFWSDPRGNYVYVDGVLLDQFPMTRNLTSGAHSLFANSLSFGSWECFGSVAIDSTNPGATTTLTVTGSGGVLLHSKMYDPFVTQDYWGVFVIGTEISVAWWVSLLATIFMPVYILASTVLSLFKMDIWYPELVGNANAPLAASFTNTANAASPTPLYFERVTNFSGSSLAVSLVTQNLLITPSGIDAYGVIGVAGITEPYLQVVRANSTAAFGNTVFVYGDAVVASSAGGSLEVTWDVHELSPIMVLLVAPQAALHSLQDPSAFVNWLVSRTDTGEILISRTLSAMGSDSSGGAVYVVIDHASAQLQASEGFTVSCQLAARTPDGGSETWLNSVVNITKPDHFDRHHPYVTWGGHTKYVYPGEPYWSAIPKRSHQAGKRWVKKVGSSRIHRTDVWRGGRRCLVADQPLQMGNPPRARSAKAPALPYSDQYVPTLSYPWNYHDTLPISPAQISQNRNAARGILCDYCFFGGPTNTTLRTDFPD